MNHIYLIGFMGTGKSTVGRALADTMDRKLLDTDELIISRDGRDIPTIFTEDGEEYFRQIERQVVSDISAIREPAVVSCGGGVVLFDENTAAMHSSGRVIWLTASAKEILRRVESDTGRPLLSGKKTIEDIQSLMLSRHGRYEAASDIVIDTDNRSVDEIVKMILGGITQ